VAVVLGVVLGLAEIAPSEDGAEVAHAKKLHEAVARGTLESQLARAQEGGGDAGQGEAAAAARADAEGEAGRGEAGNAAQPDAETGEDEAGDAAQSETGGGASGEAQEHPAGQREGEILALEPPRAVVESATRVESVPGAPVVEETRIPEPARARDEGAAAAAMERAAAENAVPVVELPSSSDEYADSRDLDTAAATSAADRIAEFVSASKEVLGAGTSEGPDHGAIVQSGIPLEFVRNEQGEEAACKAQYEVSSHIQGNLDRALQLHRMMDFQISIVGAFP
jgi:hypothetical protein